MKLRKTIAVSAVAFLMLTGCGSSGDDASKSDGADKAAQTDENPTKDDTPGNANAGGGGTLEMNGATVELTGTRCYLQEQDAAAGGGKILFTGQSSGVTADGEELMIDVSRYSEESMFAGDSIDLVIGDPFSEDAKSYTTMGTPGGGELNVVTVDDSKISAEGVDLTGDDPADSMTVSFELSC